MHPLLKALNLPKKPRRKLAQVIDVGDNEGDTVGHFVCRRCQWDSDWIAASFTECRRGIPCPLCNAPVIDRKPLFIPLKRQFFMDFCQGTKSEEFRPFGARWNFNTCPIGRRVTISLGYSKTHRRSGRIVSFRVDDHPQFLAGWVECYGATRRPAARIGIILDPIAPLTL